jgi:hypothetical protein
MGLFSKILEKLGPKKDKPAGASATAPEKPAMPAAAPARPAPSVTSKTASAPKPAPVPVAAPAPTPISEVDVVSKLEGLAAKNPAKLNWKVSIVDLLKLLDLESSFEARKEMATTFQRNC